MTVLEQYQRLECDGVWQPSADAQRRNVVVALGEATLVIKDTADTALTHWSLPAIERVNPGTMPARYRPGEADGEELELADESMIDAIRTVQKALARTGPHPGRLRLAILGAGLAGALALAVFWLPGALVGHTAEVLPKPLRAEIGQRLLRDLRPITGAPCTAPEALAVLDRLRARVVPGRDWNVVVVPDGPVTNASLPGPLVVVRADLITAADGPEALAGALVAEAARMELQHPVTRFLEAEGAWTSLMMLTRGTLPREAIADFADEALVSDRVRIASDALSAAFAAAGVVPGPYLSRAVPAEAWTPTGAIDSQPLGVSDADWLTLRTICDG